MYFFSYVYHYTRAPRLIRLFLAEPNHHRSQCCSSLTKHLLDYTTRSSSSLFHTLLAALSGAWIILSLYFTQQLPQQKKDVSTSKVPLRSGPRRTIDSDRFLLGVAF